MKIFKYTFDIEDEFYLMLSPDCHTVKVDLQDGIPTIWVLVDPDMLTKKTHFKLYGTGHEVDCIENGFYHHAGTFFQGPYVWHLFQEN
jgi:hypothetical protein